MTVRELSGRIRRRILIVFSGATAIAGAVFLAYAAVVPTGDALPVGSKAIPATLSVLSSPSLPPEVRALEASTAPLLFDRDTVTQHVAYGVSTTETTFETAQPVNAIKVYGAAPYLLTVKAESGGAYTPITGLENLNLTKLPTGWATFTAAAPVATGKLQFELTPATGGTATGLRELEVWTTSAPVNVKSGAALLNGLLGSNPPPQGRFYNAYNPTANPTTGVIAVSADDTADNIFSFTLDRSPVHFVRAYLAYELYGQQHWVSPRRKINNMSYTGGALLLPNSEWSTQVERINPAWLKEGSNTIEFSVLSSSYKEAGYTVRNVRVVLELDTGANIIDALTASQPDSTGANPLDAMRDGDLATGWKPYPADQPINAVAPSVEFAFARPTQMDAVSFYLSAPIEGEVKISAQFLNPLTNTLSWIDFPAEQGAVLTTGWNTIYVPVEVPVEARVVSAVRLSFLGGYVSNAEIREFLFVGSVVGNRATAPKVYVTYPENGEFYGRSAYIGAIVEPWNNGSGNAAVSIGGRAQIHYAGDISTWISKDTAGFTSQADSDPWSVEVKAVYPNGQTVSTIVQLTDQRSPAAPIGGTLAGSTSVVVSAKGKKTISHDESKLVFDGGTVSADTTVTVTPLADADVPALDVGMVNVTKGPRRGYRFLPHGAKFLKNVAVTLPYEKALVPPGHTEDDIKTFFFDEQAGRWVALERVAVDKSGKLVNSVTNHFTDMINAVVTVPDHPDAVSFNPTSMKDIKAADPGAQVNLIDPPGANNMGDARLSYPIEVPPGRQGLQPQLAVSYNSAGGNGWMGMGWDLPTQSISIDTRWGVPRYDNGGPQGIQPGTPLETETYTLNGEQLTPVAHRGALQPRNASGDKIFHTRVEGQFHKIIRHGNSPSAYWWEVIDKNGTRFFYGGAPEVAGGVDRDAALSDPGATTPENGNIFRWYLREVRDTNENNIRYFYDVVTDKTSGEPWQQVYLRRIRYAGTNGTDGPYEVLFNREGGRVDVSVDGRPGFKSVLDQRLTGIEVRLTAAGNALIRRYAFEYRTGQFQKTLLTKVTQFAQDGTTEFNSHAFDYFDEVATASADTVTGFNRSVSFGGAATVPGDFMLANRRSTAFGGSATRTSQGHFYLGIGFEATKDVSFGLKVGADSAKTRTKLSLVDLNGDGLVDQAYEEGGGFKFRLNTGGPGEDPYFGDEFTVDSLSQLGQEDASTRTFGGEVFLYGVTILGDTSMTRSRGNAYLSDVNGDGLPDLVAGGSVRFNRLVDRIPTFDSSSPTPIGPAVPADTSDMVTDPEELRAEMEAAYPLLDPIRRWVAPYSGTISIAGDVRLTTAPPVDYSTADGARVTIQHNNIAEPKWFTVIDDPTDTAARPISATVNVAAGDRIYFRVNSRGRADSHGDGAYDEVAINPTITYVDVDTTLTDENGQPAYLFNAAQDFGYGGISTPFKVPVAGTATLSADFVKNGATTDDLLIEITHNGTVVYSHLIAWNDSGTTPISLPLTLNALDEFAIRLHADSRIDLSRIRFAPKFVYTTINNEPAPVDENGNPVVVFSPPVAATIYPTNANATPYTPWTAPAGGSVAVEQVVAVNPYTIPANYNADITLTVKRPTGRLAKQKIAVRNGAIQGTDRLTASFSVAAGDRIYFMADASTADALQYLSIGAPLLNGDPGSIAPHEVHLAVSPTEAFGGGFRRWWFGQYNGNAFEQPINEALLRLPENDKDEVTKSFVRMIPFNGEERWRAQDKDCSISANHMSATRLMVKHLDFTDGTEFGGGTGVVRFGGGKSKVLSVSGFGFGAGETESKNWSDIDFLDFNGDRCPDVVGGGGVQATLPHCGLGGQRFGVGGFSRVRYTESVNTSVNLGSTGLRTLSSAAGKLLGIKTEQSPYNLTAGLSGGHGTTDTSWDLVDVNGDGLPDYVAPGSGGLAVRLNLGYRFGAPETWTGGGIVRAERTKLVGFNLGGGGSTDPNYGYGGGVSGTYSRAGASQDLVDVNGDGLVDIVSKPLNDDIESGSETFTVRYNTGTGFTGNYNLTGAMAQPLRGNGSYSKNAGMHFTISIGPFYGIYIHLNPGFHFGESLGGYEVQVSDFDGDGYADHIYSDTSGNVAARLNAHGRTNLLKRVVRPLGAAFNLDYVRSGNTTDQPQSRWVLASTVVFDGHKGEGVDYRVNTYAYQNGRYDRAERDFYGYAVVTEVQHHTADVTSEAGLVPSTLPVYRRVVREYHNDSFYNKGLLSREVTENAQGARFVETINSYTIAPVDDGAAVVGLEDYSATRFPKLVRTDKRFYEGESNFGKSTHTAHAYDKYGNVQSFTDDGEQTVASDNVEATIDYSWLDPACEARHIVGIAKKITVRGNNALMRHREATIDCASGDVKQVRQYLADGKVAVTDLDYFPNGNLKTVTGPANKNSQRYVLNYEYDPVVVTHVARITDSFGLSSSATHNYLYGKVETTTDTNSNQTTYLYDHVGRVEEIRGPYELTEGTPTLAFKYAIVKTPTVDGQGNTVLLSETPWALTEHVDKDAKGAYKASGTIDTLLFIDGLKRVIQTKKDATVLDDGATQPLDKMTVSGQVTFDAFGRTVAQKYPVTEAKGNNTVFNPNADGVAPTVTEYDVLDRVTKTTLPDDSVTRIDYGFGPDRNGDTQFETVVTDANFIASGKGAIKATYRDVRDLITAVKERNKSGTETIWTSYSYDPLKQIVEVKDDQGNLTKVSYDNFGRRTGIDNPDTGLTTFGYDLASNLTAKVTANLRAQTKELSYDYDFNRLKTVAFPVNTDLSVSYAYGLPGAADNTAGRITRVVSRRTATSQGVKEDSEERKYGKLGEVTYEKKTVVTFSDPLHPSVFETRYKYDTFGRLLELTYPDGEVLTNRYDSGGNLHYAEGEKGVSTSSEGLYYYRYLLALHYDKFEQRVLMEQGNGVKTAYTYNAQTRRLHGLTAGKSNGNQFQNLEYGYDRVGNVLSLKNLTDMPLANVYGGPAYQRYEYDDLYRLTRAQGVFPYNKSGTEPDASSCNGSQNTHCRVYALGMDYDTIHNIKTKNQLDTRYPPGNATGVTQKKTSYNWSYDYNPSGPASVRPHAPTHIGGLTYQYDANGNQLGWTNDQNGTKRTIVWDEENRILSLFDNGHEKTYKYDDQGNRTIKRGPQGETVYVNQFYTQRPGATGTKHVYAGTSRIASKLLRQDVPGANPAGKTPYEKDIYFYHPDHLGSSSYVTDLNARIYEHLEYFPFGEGWIEENSNVQRTPYLFTAKELDEETGLYYFGARYYDPRTSVWQSADPILGKYLPTNNPDENHRLSGMGGIYNSKNLGLYSYGFQNPVRYNDPDGNAGQCAAALAGGPPGAAVAAGCVVITAAILYYGTKAAIETGKALSQSRDTGVYASGKDESDKPASRAQDMVQSVSTPASPPPPEDPEGEKGSPVSKPLYRGGELRARPQDVKMDPQTGLVRPTHGVSLSESASAVEKFGGARQVTSVPKELQIIQRGKPGHYEIVPRQPMTFERYQELLKKVTLE